MGTTHTQLKVLLYCLTMEFQGYTLLHLIISIPLLRLLLTLPHMSCHSSCLLGSPFCIIYKSDLLHIWTAVETAGLRLSCVIHIQIGRSDISQQPLVLFAIESMDTPTPLKPPYY